MFTAKREVVEIKKQQKKHLAGGSYFSIDVIVEDDYTHAIQISHLQTGKILQTIAIDPTDRTIAGSINMDGLAALQEEAETVLSALSAALLSEMGAKEFILVPDNCTLPDFIAPENSTFTRFRHCNRDEFNERTAAILREYEELSADMDNRFHFVTDEKTLLADSDPTERYQAIHGILEQARFTPDKDAEYKNEELQGKMSRFKNKFIKPLVMLDGDNHIAGMIRILRMQNGFAYLSDEVVDQSILPVEKFKGETEEEKKYHREMFLLAYLMHKTCELGLADINHLFIIAAAGREKIYEQVGYENFPAQFSGYQFMMNFGAPKPTLIVLQEQIKALPMPEKRSGLVCGT